MQYSKEYIKSLGQFVWKKKIKMMLQQVYLIFSVIVFLIFFATFGVILFVDFVFTRHVNRF